MEPNNDIFDILGYTNEQTEEQFGHMLEALRFGTPPHGGCAHGFERPMPGQSLQMVCVWAVLVTFGSVPVWYEVVLPQASSVESTIDILADEINNI